MHSQRGKLVLCLGACVLVALGMVALGTARAGGQPAVLAEDAAAHPWAFKPTKFGPIRRKAAQSSRYNVLAMWRGAEHALETCMSAVGRPFPLNLRLFGRALQWGGSRANLGAEGERARGGGIEGERVPLGTCGGGSEPGPVESHGGAAWQEAEIFPKLDDRDCTEVDRTVNMVHECMRHQKDGFQDRAYTKNGAWDVLPLLVEMTNALGEDDREMVETKLNTSPVLYTLTRLEGLHARCHGSERAIVPHAAGNARGPHDTVARAGEVIDYAREHGGLVPETHDAAVWAKPHVDLGEDEDEVQEYPARKTVGNDSLRCPSFPLQPYSLSNPTFSNLTLSRAPPGDFPPGTSPWGAWVLSRAGNLQGVREVRGRAASTCVSRSCDGARGCHRVAQGSTPTL